MRQNFIFISLCFFSFSLSFYFLLFIFSTFSFSAFFVSSFPFSPSNPYPCILIITLFFSHLFSSHQKTIKREIENQTP